ncbi:oxygen-insensitive NADPH nitroreductase [Corynebacterium renale]|nr:oxygen-insensitive NADPH nitroreductase [Corynebacterium renale]
MWHRGQTRATKCSNVCTLAGMNQTIETQLGHRTIREFTDQPVTDEQLGVLFDVAMHTASSRGLQHASIIRVTDPDLRARLAEIGQQEYVGRAPVYLLFIIDGARHAAILEERGGDRAGVARPQVFVEGFTDACLMAQNVVVAAESLGMGANYLGNIHNDTAAVIEALDLPELTFPVVGLTVGWTNQDPQLKPRMPKKFRVMENGYQRPESWTEALKDYDADMTTYYDLRDANNRVDSYTNQILKQLGPEPKPQDGSIAAARAQGFPL